MPLQKLLEGHPEQFGRRVNGQPVGQAVEASVEGRP